MIAPIDRWHALEPFEHRGTKSSWLHWLVGHALAKTEWERAGEEFYVAGTNNVHADGRRGSTEARVIDNSLGYFSFGSFDMNMNCIFPSLAQIFDIALPV